MTAELVDGQDVGAVYTAAMKFVERARRGLGPAFLQANTYRYHGHHVGDTARTFYRQRGEEEQWRTTRDPIALFADTLVREQVADRARLARTADDVAEEIDRAVTFAIDAPYPDPSKVTEDIYA
jgi:pyruvate dehydrogenase E1 component alpha subunit